MIKLWPLLAGFTLWAAGFVTLYAVQALGCIWSWPEPWHRTTLVALALGLITALLALLVWQQRRPEKRALDLTGMALTAAALAVSIAVFSPTLFTSLCT